VSPDGEPTLLVDKSLQRSINAFIPYTVRPIKWQDGLAVTLGVIAGSILLGLAVYCFSPHTWLAAKTRQLARRWAGDGAMHVEAVMGYISLSRQASLSGAASSSQPDTTGGQEKSFKRLFSESRDTLPPMVRLASSDSIEDILSKKSGDLDADVENGQLFGASGASSVEDRSISKGPVHLPPLLASAVASLSNGAPLLASLWLQLSNL